MVHRKTLLNEEQQRAYDEYVHQYNTLLLDEWILQGFLTLTGICVFVLGLRNALLLLEPGSIEQTVSTVLFVSLMGAMTTCCIIGAARSFDREMALKEKWLPEHLFLQHYRHGTVPVLRPPRGTKEVEHEQSQLTPSP